MTSDLLRRAARDMRAKAEAVLANVDEWYTPIETLALLQSRDPYSTTQAFDAAYIAAMHPAVALAVADWLDWLVDLKGKANLGWDMPEDHPALTLARTYLGEQP